MRSVYCLAALCFFMVSPALAAGNDGAWTELQVKKYCYGMARKNGDSASYFDQCMQNNENRIGRPKQAVQISELNAADRRLKRMANERVAEETKAEETTTDQPKDQ